MLHQNYAADVWSKTRGLPSNHAEPDDNDDHDDFHQDDIAEDVAILDKVDHEDGFSAKTAHD